MEFNLFENNFEDEFKDDNLEFQSDFPLFNFNVLKNVEYEDAPLNLLDRKVSEIIGEILCKKVKGEQNALVIPKKRGRKAIAKNGKAWDDPTITMREIIENDLAGIPMESEVKMKEEKLRKMREKKALKKAEREKGTLAIENAINNANEVKNDLVQSIQPIFGQTELALVPQIIFKDGKIVVDNGNAREEKKLTVVENKKAHKVTSMSFRTKNQTAKWTEEETRKFFKAIEIFGADFSMIAKLFPTRNRDQVKNKFHKEEKVNTLKMDEAFGKNKLLSKRSIMDRIKNFSNNFTANGEFEGLALGNNNLERTLSNTSIDSMEGKIMDEIQEIFLKEIKPQNTFVNSLGFTATPKIENEKIMLTAEKKVEVKIAEKEEVVKNERQNLLLKILN